MEASSYVKSPQNGPPLHYSYRPGDTDYKYNPQRQVGRKEPGKQNMEASLPYTEVLAGSH